MSGSGRGRGWLKLGQNAVPAKPGLDLPKKDPVIEEKANQDDLVELFNLLNFDDDGIAINNKIFHIRNELMKKCPDVNLIKNYVEAIYGECLTNESFSKKVILFISSAHFKNKQKSEEQVLWRDTFRRSFITHLQNDFEDGQRNREMFPIKFYNGVRLCSDYFYNIKKFQSHGYPHVEKVAILGYIKLLLNYDTPKDTKLIAHLVCRHSPIIADLLDDETCQLHKELFNKLKKMLVCGTSLPKTQRIFVFFIYELLSNRFNMTEDKLEFYRSNMIDDDFSEISLLLNDLLQLTANFNEQDNMKTSEEQNNQFIERDGTNKSFMHQLPEQGYKLYEENTSCSSSEQEINHTIRIGVSEDLRYKTNECNSRSKENYVKPNRMDNPRNHTNYSAPERVGRPILGVGARLKKM